MVTVQGHFRVTYIARIQYLLLADHRFDMQEQGGTLEQSLTPRETDILRLVAASFSNKEIANELYLALTTVKWYIRQLHTKLGTSNRKSLITAAREIGFDENADIARIPNNLTQSMSGFIGRAVEIEQLASLLTEGSRQIVTLLAPGGMGKTQLALATAQQVLSEFPDGVFFVDLTPLQSSENIASLIADVTGYQSHQDARSLQQQMVDYLSDKTMLLILDNFEHLLDGAALVTDLSEHCPTLVLLVTSRERLRLSRETVFALHGMSYREGNETTESDLKRSDLKNDAFTLLESAARRVRPDFELNEINYPIAERICQLTDGMPLAIILAMNWLELLSLAEIVTELQTSTEFLTSNLSDLPDRHSSMRAVFEPTWNRLTPEEQAVFARMSIFRGGCTREAAQSVTEASLHTLQTLVQKALISRAANGHYRVHELLRQFAEEKLSLKQHNDILSRHTSYYLELIQSVPLVLIGRDLYHYTSDLENFRLMWSTLLDAHRWDDLSFASDGIFHLFYALNYLDDAYKLFNKTRERLASQESIPESLSTRIDIYEVMAARLSSQDVLLCEQNQSAVDQIFEASNTDEYLHPLHYGLLTALMCVSNTDETYALMESRTLHALEIAEKAGDSHLIVSFLNTLSFYANRRSKEEANRLLSRAFKITEVTDSYLRGWTFEMLGLNYFYSCDYENALDCYVQSYLFYEEKESHAFQLGHLNEVAMTAFTIGDYEMAAEYYNLASRLARKLKWREHQLAHELFSINVSNATGNLDASWQTLNQVAKQIAQTDSHELKDLFDVTRGEILIVDKQFEEAQRCFEQVVARDETNIDAMLGLSQTCYELGRPTEALEYAYKMLQLAKDQYAFPSLKLWILVEFANPIPAFEKVALLSYVIQHRGTVFHVRERANRLLSEMQHNNTQDWIEKAKNHVSDMDLDDLIDYFLDKYAPTGDTTVD